MAPYCPWCGMELDYTGFNIPCCTELYEHHKKILVEERAKAPNNLSFAYQQVTIPARTSTFTSPAERIADSC